MKIKQMFDFMKGANMDITYEIIKWLGNISRRRDTKGEVWTKEVNIVSWNHRPPKVDIREWSEDHSRMSKGITLTEDEAEALAMHLHEWARERKAK